MVLLGITFFFALYRFDEVRAKISMVMGVFMPFITGFAIAYLLNSPMCFFERTLYRNLRYRRGLSIVTVYLLGVAILSILLNLIIPQVVQSITDLMVNMQTYLEQLNTLVQSLIARFHLEGEGITDLVISYQELMNKITRLASDAMPKILNFGVAVGSGVVTAITALISSIYMLAGKGRLVPQLKKLTYAIAPRTSAERFLSVCSRANGVFVGFINGKLIDSAIIGVLCFILTMIFRIPYPVLVSVVVGVTNIIPFFGPIIGAVPCVMILLIVDPWAAVRFGILVIALQQFDGNILGPKILGDSTGLSAIWVLVAIVVGGGLFGFPGMLLGVPTFAVLYSLVREWTNARLESKGIDGDGNPLPTSRGTEEES
ncbi:AI-2E family transporter [Intestinimonas massiliensis]|uniref:AI-2E family transporter n=1 Tax=Intestinimonas massiliensis (ex Afouda et al. 2020) TaxID=1673721 RepID=A0AAW5JPR9_9FIRM|nr:AI-2E family transporter [Intestinimonas massiliensis (ex Afouda et al. 2020)]